MGIVRFFLALSVVMWHLGGFFGLRPMDGWIAVEGFFIISGFYMALVLATKYPATPVGTAIFYTNRYLRLYPTYLVVFVLMVAALAIVGRPASSIYSLDQIFNELRQMDFLSATYILFANLTMLGADLASSLRNVDHNLAYAPGQAGIATHFYMIIPQAWTIGTELTFYVIAPVLLRLRTRWLLAIAALSLTLRVVLLRVFHLPIDPWAHAFFPDILYLFLLGALAYRLQLGKLLLKKSNYAPVIWVILTAYIVFFYELPESDSVRYWGFLGLLTLSISPVFDLSKSLHWDRLIGELSYPLYLCHLLVDYAVSNTLGPSFHAATIFGSIAFAAFLVLAVDRNIDILRNTIAAHVRQRSFQPLPSADLIAEPVPPAVEG